MPEQSGSAKVYHDIYGEPCTLRALIRDEPEWAHSRITVMENELKELREGIAKYQKTKTTGDQQRMFELLNT